MEHVLELSPYVVPSAMSSFLQMSSQGFFWGVPGLCSIHFFTFPVFNIFALIWETWFSYFFPYIMWICFFCIGYFGNRLKINFASYISTWNSSHLINFCWSEQRFRRLIKPWKVTQLLSGRLELILTFLLQYHSFIIFCGKNSLKCIIER